jgi:hypothetical protein
MTFKPRQTQSRKTSTNGTDPAQRQTPQFKPIVCRTERFTQAEIAQTLDRSKSNPLEDRKTLRTVIINADASIAGACIDLVTGEITARQYRAQPKRSRPRAKTIDTVENPPHWTRIPPPDRGVCDPLADDKGRKKLLNPLKNDLHGYLTLSDVYEDFPFFESILHGTLLLDMGGNTRCLRPAVVFAMLQHLKIISSETVRSFIGCSARHAQKVAQCLRIIVTAFVSERRHRPVKCGVAPSVSGFERKSNAGVSPIYEYEPDCYEVLKVA